MKRAFLDVSSDLFRLPVGNLFEAMYAAGLSVVASAASSDSIVRLVIEELPGREVLPDECAQGWYFVSPAFVQEQVGAQKIVRVSAVHLGDKANVMLAG